MRSASAHTGPDAGVLIRTAYARCIARIVRSTPHARIYAQRTADNTATTYKPMSATIKNLLDVNYIIFCNALQIAGVFLFSTFQGMPHMAWPSAVAFCQMQTSIVLYVVHVVAIFFTPNKSPENEATAPEKENDKKNTVSPDPVKPGALFADAAAQESKETVSLMAYFADVWQCLTWGAVHVYSVYAIISTGVLLVSIASTISCSRASPTNALQWEEVGRRAPQTGSLLRNSELEEALMQTHTFSQTQWDKFRVNLVSGDIFVKIGDFYMRPAVQDRSLCENTWQGTEGLWLGVAFCIVQASVCVTAIQLFKRNAELSAVRAWDYAIVYYTLFVWSVQYILTLHESVPNGKECPIPHKTSRQMQMFTVIFAVVCPLVLFGLGFVHIPLPQEGLQIRDVSSQLRQGSRLIHSLGFVFYIITTGFMFQEHQAIAAFDIVVFAYVIVTVASAVWLVVKLEML